MERAMAHICEAYIAINEARPVRTVQQLVDDLNRIQQVMDDAKPRQNPNASDLCLNAHPTDFSCAI